ncbi:NAD-dependent epimerase/dehydratase family protein [Eubacterium oxidoreducens]|uniref:Nucleoside-diphosphate-sugar epimerase n=1 Tax=Eubacterium oxidoreducens TaxID=1732 RepID=A0A1G6CNQ7_EUBOX|nr:NAD-dependent epimerase/dehydratase family protein [Eubacterium oxidoreducens]SDB34452.1 Nucleoside-diphosphate-sugar epimerase [Eubacterium oxidoreducens]
MLLESMNDAVLQQDLEDIARSDIDFRKMQGAVILVTGATGLVGSTAVKALALANREQDLHLTIRPLIRNEQKARAMYGQLWDRDCIQPVVADITKELCVEGDVDYIIHGASVTASKTMVTRPVETIDIALMGTKNILELAKEKKTKSVVYLSSMEAFGVTDPSLDCVREENLGYVDVTNVRSCYPEGKRMCELMCACYAAEYQVPAKVARLAQTFGAGVPKEDGRVFAQFAKSAMAGEDIVLHTKGESTGNYCYTADCIRGILTILLNGVDAEVYTVANPSTAIKIKDLARLVADTISDGKSNVVFDIPEGNAFGYAPDVAMHLNSDKLQSLGWKPRVDLPEMFERLCESFRQQGI